MTVRRNLVLATSFFFVLMAAPACSDFSDDGLQSVYAGNGASLWSHSHGEDDGPEETYIPDDGLPNLGAPGDDCLGEAGLPLFPDDEVDHPEIPWTFERDAAEFAVDKSIRRDGNVVNVGWDAHYYGENDYVLHIADADGEPLTLDLSWAIDGSVDDAEGGSGTSQLSFDVRFFNPADGCRELTDDVALPPIDFDDDGAIEDAVRIESELSELAMWITVEGRVSARQHEYFSEEGEEADIPETTSTLNATFSIEF